MDGKKSHDLCLTRSYRTETEMPIKKKKNDLIYIKSDWKQVNSQPGYVSRDDRLHLVCVIVNYVQKHSNFLRMMCDTWLADFMTPEQSQAGCFILTHRSSIDLFIQYIS